MTDTKNKKENLLPVETYDVINNKKIQLYCYCTQSTKEWYIGLYCNSTISKKSSYSCSCCFNIEKQEESKNPILITTVNYNVFTNFINSEDEEFEWKNKNNILATIRKIGISKKKMFGVILHACENSYKDGREYEYCLIFDDVEEQIKEKRRNFQQNKKIKQDNSKKIILTQKKLFCSPPTNDIRNMPNLIKRKTIKIKNAPMITDDEEKEEKLTEQFIENFPLLRQENVEDSVQENKTEQKNNSIKIRGLLSKNWNDISSDEEIQDVEEEKKEEQIQDVEQEKKEKYKKTLIVQEHIKSNTTVSVDIKNHTSWTDEKIKKAYNKWIYGKYKEEIQLSNFFVQENDLLAQKALESLMKEPEPNQKQFLEKNIIASDSLTASDSSTKASSSSRIIEQVDITNKNLQVIQPFSNVRLSNQTQENNEPAYIININSTKTNERTIVINIS